MRLFIAINFSDELKDEIFTLMQTLESGGVRGSFVLKENIHLTLKFLGETQRLDDIKAVMDNIQSNPFTLNLESLGRFKKRGGDILWLGVRQNPKLRKLYLELEQNLSELGFEPDRREFSPHITIARRAITPNGFNFKRISIQAGMQVERISLMRSQRISGRLVYSEIYAKDL